MNLGERKLKILSAVVELFVQTGEPVGSKALCNQLDFSVSSATIRNEMAELSEFGLLEQPHTSAGRIPSHLGYRVYINELMNPDKVSHEEKELINGVLLSSSDHPDHLLKEASQVLASLTKFAAISTAPRGTSATVKKIQLAQTGRRSAMAILIASCGIIKSQLFRCDYDLTPEILEIFYKVLNEKFCGVQVSAITQAFIQSVAASLGELALLMSCVLNAVLGAAEDACSADIRLDGESNLLFVPEFDVNSARSIVEFLNRRRELTDLLFENRTRRTNVLIGSESNRPELADSSVIITHYTVGGKDCGAIAIIGPTRMNYAKTIASLEYLSGAVGKLLSEILDVE